MDIRGFFRTNKYTEKLYKDLKSSYYRKKNITVKYRFINRSKGGDKLCIILAGYKNFLLESVMGRIKKYAPEEVDVCIITSGKWSEEINELCEKNNWSYLSTQRNNVSLAQNVAIDLHKSARYIYKLDEDIFITNDYFEKMFDAYKACECCTDYRVGILAPLIPINGYGHVQIIREFGLEEVYKSLFGDLKAAAGSDRKIEASPELAKFMWGEAVDFDGKEYKLPSIDDMNMQLGQQKQKIKACPVRFSIGAILFERKLWEDMNFFRVDRGPGMGTDEAQICEYCMMESRPIMVSHNTVVGHLAFGGQNYEMKEYYKTHKALFLPKKKDNSEI